jgi:hypothetical protein
MPSPHISQQHNVRVVQACVNHQGIQTQTSATMRLTQSCFDSMQQSMRPASASTRRLAGPWKVQRNATPEPVRTNYATLFGSTNRPSSADPTRRSSTPFSENSNRFNAEANNGLPRFKVQGLLWTANPEIPHRRIRSAMRTHGVDETTPVAIPSIEVHLELPPKDDLQEATIGRFRHKKDITSHSWHSMPNMSTTNTSACHKSATRPAGDHLTPGTGPADMPTRYTGTEASSADTPDTLGRNHAFYAEGPELESVAIHKDSKQPTNQPSHDESTGASMSQNHNSINSSQKGCKSGETRATKGSSSSSASSAARTRSIRVASPTHKHAHSAQVITHTDGSVAGMPRSHSHGSKTSSRNEVCLTVDCVPLMSMTSASCSLPRVLTSMDRQQFCQICMHKAIMLSNYPTIVHLTTHAR